MPVKITELVIKIIIDDELTADKRKSDPEQPDKEVIITEYVEQNPEIPKKEKER